MSRRMSLSPFRSRRSTRTLGVALVGLAATLGLSACQWTSPITTQLQYDAAEGKSVQVGDVKVLNAVVVAKAKDAPGVLSATFVNPGADKRTVQIRVGEQIIGAVDVPAGQTVAVGGAAKPMQIAKVPAAPGAMTEVLFATQPSDVTPVNLAVLAPQGPYETMTPTAIPSPTSAPVTSGTPTAPGTPTASGTPTAPGTSTATATGPTGNTLPATSPATTAPTTTPS